MPDTAARRIAVEAVARVVAVAADGARVAAVAGGTDARSFKVEIGGVCVFAKLPDAKAGLTLDSAAEFALLERLAANDLTPRPIGLDVQSGVLVSEFAAAARPLQAQDLAAADMLDALARALRELHSVAFPLRAFEPLGFAQHYAARAQPQESALVERHLAEIDALVSRNESAIVGAGLCHNDLHVGNLLVERTADGPRIWFTDLEYAVAAPPIVDIASFAASNQLPRAIVERLLSVYYAGRQPAFDDATFDDVVRMHELLAGLWKLARNDNNERQFAAREERMKGTE